MNETVGMRLRRLRTEQGLSQRDVAGTHMSYAYVCRIENGERTPSVRTLRQLATSLGVSADYLETGRENPLREALVEIRAVAAHTEAGDLYDLLAEIDGLAQKALR